MLLTGRSVVKGWRGTAMSRPDQPSRWKALSDRPVGQPQGRSGAQGHASGQRQQRAGQPRNRRRKDARPEEILEAALEEFARKGYAAARLDCVAQRAGIAKGTIYLYFSSKEELFKATVRHALFPQVAQLEALIPTFSGTTEAFLRGPFKELQRLVLRSDLRLLARILITEGHAFPDLTEFYYQEVIQRGMNAMRAVVARGVARGEFRESGLTEHPQPLMASAILAVVWQWLLDRHEPLDVERLLDTHIDLLLEGLKVRPASFAPERSGGNSGANPGP